MGGPRPPARAISQLIGELSHIYAKYCSHYMRPKFQLSILMNKKSEVFSHKEGPLCGPGVELTHTCVHHCI